MERLFSFGRFSRPTKRALRSLSVSLVVLGLATTSSIIWSKTKSRLRAGESVAVQLKFTQHGPVIFEDTVHHKAFAIRTVWTQPGTAG
jgi:hypothetical protein